MKEIEIRKLINRVIDEYITSHEGQSLLLSKWEDGPLLRVQDDLNDLVAAQERQFKEWTKMLEQHYGKMLKKVLETFEALLENRISDANKLLQTSQALQDGIQSSYRMIDKKVYSYEDKI